MYKINKIAGVDEVGRGCLAGPVFAAAVILNKNINIKESLKIQKKSLLKKEFCFQNILKITLFYAVGFS